MNMLLLVGIIFAFSQPYVKKLEIDWWKVMAQLNNNLKQA